MFGTCAVAWLMCLQVVALANVTILTGSIANLLCNIARRSPVKPGPIIDYDLLLLVRGVDGGRL